MEATDTTYHDLIARNRRNSALLVLGFVLFVAFVAGVLGAGLGSGEPGVAVGFGLVALVGAVLMATWSWFRGADAILRMSGASRLAKAEDPELYNVVEEMAIAAGVPVPAVYLIDDTALNAFATGRDPQHAAVAITRGLRERLDRAELQAVMAHELSHVRHYDIRLAMLLATLVGVVVLLSDAFWRGTRWRLWSGGRSRREGVAGVLLLVVAVLLAALAPMVAKVIQLAASRQREYMADAGAVELTRNPEAMIGALRRLGGDREVLEAANRATAHLYIVQPIKKWEKRAQGLLSTHPPLEERIARLERLLR